jgi:WG containing repeat
MLQNPDKEKSCFLFITFCILFLAAGCKPDSPGQSEAESAYMADYEAPSNKWGYMDKTGTLVIKPQYDDAASFSEGLAAVNISGKWGFINKEGDVVIEPRFRSAWAFHENKARVEPFDQPAYFIDKSGKVVPSGQWTAAGDFSGGLAKVIAGNLIGYIDTSGQLVIKTIYSRGSNFELGMAVVEYEDQLSVINPYGHYLIPGPFDHVKINAEDDIVLCRKGETSIVYDIKGNEITRLENAKLVESGGSLISVRQGSEMFFYDLRSKKFKKDEIFSTIIYLGEKRWTGKKTEGYALLDQDGHIMNDKRFLQINKYSYRITAYNINELWGYMDLYGNTLTQEVFGLAWDYKEGLARAAFQEGIAFIDIKQQLAFYPPEGTMDMRDFSEGLAAIQIAR